MGVAGFGGLHMLQRSPYRHQRPVIVFQRLPAGEGQFAIAAHGAVQIAEGGCRVIEEHDAKA